jgi:hypothetical protein
VRSQQRADDDGGNNPIAERQTIRGAEQLRYNGRDDTEYDAAGLRLPKKVDLNFKPGSEHQQQPPKITEKLHDRVVHRGNVKNVRPDKDSER